MKIDKQEVCVTHKFIIELDEHEAKRLLHVAGGCIKGCDFPDVNDHSFQQRVWNLLRSAGVEA